VQVWPILTQSSGMVETEFSIIRFRGDTSAAAKVYDGLQPCTYRSIQDIYGPD
jgi:NADP-dependent 3-hydroxy acid dehydrogenase YdfG